MDETKDKLICMTHHIDDISLEKLKKELQDEKEIDILSGTFKALSDSTRLKIIYILSKSSLCVCDIASILDMTQSAISHQLRILRDMKLVRFKREGKLVIYSLDDDHVLGLFEQALDHVKHK
jgi:DNA-binding transcriptional ArsR family regulator